MTLLCRPAILSRCLPLCREIPNPRKGDPAMRKALKILLVLLLTVLVLAAAYVAYVFLAYYRIEDQQVLTVEGSAIETLRPGQTCRAISYNIGFGAYESDYSFFMDGGTQSWAWSEERLRENLDEIAALLQAENADFLLLQEVDVDATRTYHFDESAVLRAAFPDRACVYAQNYDSPFLLYPFTQPHGASRAGMLTFSRYAVSSSLRRSLPIEGGFRKFLDLDRCYSVCRLPVEGGKELVLYTLHLSAYSADGSISVEQLKLLLADMQAEYEKGNYSVAGGDFNKDLLGNSAQWFGAADREYTWAQPLPEDIFDGTGISLAAPLDEKNPVPSCRNADAPYHEGQYVLTVDGFLVSGNVTVEEAAVLDTGFAHSDHNPVSLTFTLNAG